METRDQGKTGPTEQQHSEGVHNFDTFTEHVGQLFQNQSRDNDEQFAVLFLASESDYTKTVFRMAAGPVNTPSTATNNAYPIFPPNSSDLCNYIVARNDGPDHAETLHKTDE